jgi:MT0933-like antitoxin protein
MDEAKKFADSHEEQVDSAVEKAGQEADERTGNRYDSQIQKGEKLAEEHIGDGPDNEQNNQ